MSREIVFGDLWGIDEDVWIQLWSGAVGAVVSAGVAAVVAVLVLTSSNAHQRRLSAFQLKEQRKDASRAREQTAIAEVIVAAEDFVDASAESMDEVAKMVRVFRSAVGRWRAELGIVPMQSELIRWPQIFRAASILRIEGRVNGGEEAERAATLLLTSAMAALCGTALAWQGSDDAERDELLEALTKQRLEFAQTLRDMSAGRKIASS